ncbi:HAMP domain-containing histidine kinase [Prolixibacteraceae bacterium JC049]|nr:HAMP domain-containing histidine kinase [Prolixibacteraceae bacterium JC049]
MKKVKKEGYLVIATIVVLIALVAIQVTWISNAVRLEEQSFNHNVVMALNGAKEGISKHTKTCNSMQRFLCGRACPKTDQTQTLARLDSIIHTNLLDFGIDLKYKFEIVNSKELEQNRLFSPKCYQKSLNGLLELNGIHLRIEFPDRNKFLTARMMGMFVISIVLILLVMISFFITLRLFRKEKELSLRLTDFVNNMVHEFQTPLSNIGFATNLIRKKQKNNDLKKLDEYTGIIITEKEKMQRNVEEILKISCAEKHELSDNEPLNIHQLIEVNRARFEPKVVNAKGKLIMNLKADNDLVVGHRSHLSNVFSNLFDNALKYNSGQPEIKVTTSVVQNKLQISFQDNGIGISPKNLPFIFDKYYRVSTGDVHTVKGFGLGLTYVKHVLEQHDGKIEVKSNLGKGTTFVISLPLK